MEFDALRTNIEISLTQNQQVVSCESTKLIKKLKSSSSHDKKMLAIMQQVKTFRQYFLGKKIIIKTGHQSLKNLLTQKPLSKQQSNSVNKLQGFGIVID